MRWWFWLILELLVIFGEITWIYFTPSELWEEDFCKALLAYVLIFCIKKIRKYFKGNRRSRTDAEKQREH